MKKTHAKNILRSVKGTFSRFVAIFATYLYHWAVATDACRHGQTACGVDAELTHRAVVLDLCFEGAFNALVEAAIEILYHLVPLLFAFGYKVEFFLDGCCEVVVEDCGELLFE